MKNLSQFKNAIQVGTKLKVTTYWFGKPETTIRTVVKAQTTLQLALLDQMENSLIAHGWIIQKLKIVKSMTM